MAERAGGDFGARKGLKIAALPPAVLKPQGHYCVISSSGPGAGGEIDPYPAPGQRTRPPNRRRKSNL